MPPWVHCSHGGWGWTKRNETGSTNERHVVDTTGGEWCGWIRHLVDQ